jgi:hypothetical protein
LCVVKTPCSAERTDEFDILHGLVIRGWRYLDRSRVSTFARQPKKKVAFWRRMGFRVFARMGQAWEFSAVTDSPTVKHTADFTDFNSSSGHLGWLERVRDLAITAQRPQKM